MIVEVIAVGTELLLGQIINSNTSTDPATGTSSRFFITRSSRQARMVELHRGRRRGRPPKTMSNARRRP